MIRFWPDKKMNGTKKSSWEMSQILNDSRLLEERPGSKKNY